MAAMLNKQGHGTVYFGISDHGFVYGQMTGHETLQVLAQAFVDNIEQATNILFYAIRLSRKRCFVQEI